jgi:hypothetical protein
MTRVTTPTGRTGTIAPNPFDFPLYTFVSFDDGVSCWIRSDILKPFEAKASKKKSKKP